MGIGLSLFLIAVGAVLAWAVNATVTGIDLQVAGSVLMVVGVLGLVLSLLFWSSFAPFAESAPFRSRVAPARPVEHVVTSAPPTTIVHERPANTVFVDSDPSVDGTVRERRTTTTVVRDAPRDPRRDYPGR